jgi:hypothetical protein
MIRAMRDDGALAALERGLRRPLALAGAAFIITMGVFVVGLMLIVDSASSVRFPTSVVVIEPNPSRGVVPVHIDLGASGSTEVATLRGGQATATLAPPIGDAGQVGYRKAIAPSQPNSVAATVTPPTKKTDQRATSIGATSGPNGDSGLAVGASGPTGGGGSTSAPSTGIAAP